ncbi:MAG: archaeosortase/exosortase family protein, partial [Anaerolineales bacterium]|nr:archaeosortase/exosortase family protein [Anaerolineales bacterium]
MTILKRENPQSNLTMQPFSAQTFFWNVLILAAWLWLFSPLANYLTVIFSREDFRTNQILLVGIIILLIVQMHKGSLRLKPDAPPQWRLRPFLLLLLSATSFLLVERFLDINTLSAGLFGLATYGLIGLWLPPHQWRSGLPAALLLIGTLPFGDHMQTFIGYPMRILTAGIVQDGLATVGFNSVGV